MKFIFIGYIFSCHKGKVGSKKVLQKVVMIYEGKLRDGQKNIDGSYSNLELYSILKNEFLVLYCKISK